MSKTTTDNPVIEIAPTEESSEQTEATVEKQSFIQKSRTFVQNHKKSTIAVGALVGLVGVAALTGRKTAPSPAPEPLELTEAEDVIDVEVLVPADDSVTA